MNESLKPPPIDPLCLAEAQAMIEDLGLSNVPGIGRTVGRPPKAFHVEYERDLTEADHAALTLPKGSNTQFLHKIRASHHALARCLATGMRNSQASLVTGYAPVTISVLLNDPAFKALVEDYKQESRTVFGDLAERMGNLSLDAISEIQERLTDKPEEFSTNTLLDLVTKFADRTGFGPNQDVTLRVKGDFIDRPPRESFEDWEKRRNQELGGNVIPLKLVSGPANAAVSEVIDVTLPGEPEVADEAEVNRVQSEAEPPDVA